MLSQKKKVAILTRHDVPNYGSFLQTLATQKLIEDISLYPTIIDYKRKDDSTSALIKQYSREHKNILYYVYYHTVWKLSHSHIEKVMENERKKYLKCSKSVDKNSIKEILKNYDMYMTGSDQVWNKVGSGSTKEIDETFFWNKVSEGAKVFSYAASFGDSKLSDNDYKKCFEGLKKFKYISVREDSGVELVNNMGYECTQVIDPTMLVSREFWDEIVKTSSFKPKRKYALIYNLHSNSNMKDFIIRDLKGSDLDVYSISTTYRKVMGKNVFCPPVQDFLYLFKNASCVYADSFHAIAFSIIFNTPIVVTLPKQYSTRLESILRLFGLEDCLCDKKKGKAWNENRIDWKRVNKILNEEKEKSWKWLKSVVGDFMDEEKG